MMLFPEYILNFDITAIDLADPSFYMILLPPVAAAGAIYGPKLPEMLGKIKGGGNTAGAAANHVSDNRSAQLVQQIPGPGGSQSQTLQQPQTAVRNDKQQPDGPKIGVAHQGNIPQPPSANIGQGGGINMTNPGAIPPMGGSHLSPQFPGVNPNVNAPAAPQVIINTEAIDQKIKPIAEGISTTKTDIAGIKKEMDSLKTNIQDLSTTFETSLLDLKAFQAEMINPINFMRKYFDSMDIKNLSDPTNALQSIDQAQKSSSPGSSPPAPKQAEQNQQTAPEKPANSEDASRAESKRAEEKQTRSNNPTSAVQTETTAPRQGAGSANSIAPSLTLRPLANMGSQEEVELRKAFETGLTPGKIMSVVSMIDEILGSMGPDGVDILVEQYKLMGLRPEDELVIYNVLRMLNDSKVYTDDIIAMLYRFGQILGINDKEAELQYARLIASKNRKASNRPRGGVE